MERFIRLNRSILDCDLAKGGWRLDEEGITAIEDEVAELVRIAIGPDGRTRSGSPNGRTSARMPTASPAHSAPPSPTAKARRRCARPVRVG